MKAPIRREHDAYYTPDDLALACVRQLSERVPALPDPPRIVEPSVGGGAFARAARGVFPGCEITGVDIDPAAPGLADCDYQIAGPWFGLVTPVLIAVGNPPYRQAEQHATMALESARVVGQLMRLSFLASQRRRAFWNAYPPASVSILSKRPSFTGGGTDNSEYCWIVWDRLHTGPPVLGWLHWQDTHGAERMPQAA